MTNSQSKAKKIFRARGGILRTSEAIKAGIHHRTLYELRNSGELDQLARGVYRLSELQPLPNLDLIIASKRVCQGVICLISALAFHELTTQVPHRVHIALPRNARRPKLDYPPLQVYHFSEDAYSTGKEKHNIEGTNVRIYSPEKTLADCFKYRNKIGLDILLEALSIYRSKGNWRWQKILEAARACRVENAMRPYLEASI